MAHLWFIYVGGIWKNGMYMNVYNIQYMRIYIILNISYNLGYMVYIYVWDGMGYFIHIKDK